MHYNDTQLKGKLMKNLKKQFMEDPMFAVTVVIVGAAAAAALLNGVAHLVGSSGYALHAAKR